MKLMSDINVHFENKKASRGFFVFIWLLYSTVYMTKNCFSGALSAIVQEGTLTLTQATWINAAFFVAYAPLQVLGGMFADKYSPEKLITIGLIGSAISNAIIFFNQNFYVMLISWVFNALIQFALWPAVYKILSSQLVRSDRSAMMFYISFSSLGGLVLTYVVSAFMPDWRYNFALSAVVLILFALCLQFACLRLSPIIKKDAAPESIAASLDVKKGTRRNKGVWKIFAVSGFLVFLPSVFFKYMIDNSVKTLSPTMLMQSYENVSHTIGNLLNVFILLSGALGIVLTRYLIFPKIIKNELVCYTLMLGLALPFAVVLKLVGALPIWLIVMSLCFISLLMSSTAYLTNHYNLRFIQHGLNGTVAGTINSAASFGAALQFLAFGSIADNLGWQTVTSLWVILVAVSFVCAVVTICLGKRFFKE